MQKLRRRGLSAASEVMDTINVTNLVDIIMVMLIIFIILAPIIEQGIDIRLPEASAKTMSSEQSVFISLAHDGQVYLDNRKVTLNGLEKRLKVLVKRDPNISVMIRADKNLLYHKIIRVLDMVRATGITRLGLATRGKKST